MAESSIPSDSYSPPPPGGYPAFTPTMPSYRPTSPGFDIYTFMEKLLIRRKKMANRALDHYNKTMGAKFALVEDDTLDSLSFSKTWIHICFNATDSSIKQCNAEDPHSPIKLFFAEIKYSQVSMPSVTSCQIVEGETRVGCDNCHKVIHPVDIYRENDFDYTQIVEADEDTCNKLYDEEFTGYLDHLL